MDETEIAGRLSAVEQRSKSNSHRLDAVEKNTEAVNHLATSVAVMAERMEITGDEVDGLCSDVQDLKAEPGKRWKFVVEKAVYIAVSAVMGYILAKFGLG